MTAPPQLLTAERARELGARFAAALERRGVGSRARVAFVAGNSDGLLAAILGTLLSGRAPVVLSGGLTDREREELLGDARPALVVTEPALAEMLEEPGTPTVRLAATFACRPMHFTSGTSGRPKGVWSGWLGPEQALALAEEERVLWGFGPGDRHLVCAPLSHSAPLRFALNTLLHGGAVLVQRTFDADEVARTLLAGEATTTFLAPTHLQRLLAADGIRGKQVEGMRWVAHAGSACPAAVREEAAGVFGDEALVEFYGSTEGQFTVCPYVEWRARPGTVGRARAGRRLRVDDEGRIWCRVPDFARFSYWGDPAKTADAWDGDWFTVGDLGRLDDDGYLYLDGRRSDLVISGGVNVYPAEVERVLGELAGVEQVVVVGVDDVDWGQRVSAVVTGAVTPDDVLAHARTELAPYKRPKAVRVVTDLPLTHSGKIDRRRVADELAP